MEIGKPVNQSKIRSVRESANISISGSLHVTVFMSTFVTITETLRNSIGLLK